MTFTKLHVVAVATMLTMMTVARSGAAADAGDASDDAADDSGDASDDSAAFEDAADAGHVNAPDACNQTSPLCCKINEPCNMGDDGGSPPSGCSCMETTSASSLVTPLALGFPVVVLSVLRRRRKR